MTPGQIAAYKQAKARYGSDAEQAEAARRAQRFADARALLDRIEANPDVPFDGLEIRHTVIAADDTEGVGRILDAAIALRIRREVDDGHHRVVLRHGTASYQTAYVERDRMARWRRSRDLGNAAVAAEEGKARP